MTNEHEYQRMIKFLKISNYYLPQEYVNNLDALIYCLENKKTKLIMQFNDDLFTEEITKKYASIIVDSIQNERLFNLKFDSNILEYALEKNRIGLIPRFSYKAFTDEIIRKYENKILNIFEEYIPWSWRKSDKILKLCLDKNILDLVTHFNKEALTEEIVAKYGDKIIDFLEKEDNISVFDDSLILLKACLEKGKIHLINEFDYDIITEEIALKYPDEIIEMIKNSTIPTWRLFENILISCFEKKRIDLIETFYKTAFDEKIINRYGDYLIEIIETNFNNIIPDNLKSNKFLFDKLLNLKKYDLCFQFDNALFYEYLNNQEFLNYLSIKLDILPEDLIDKLKYLHSKNNDVFNTLQITMLSKKMSHINLDDLEKIVAHKNIQDKLLILNENKIKIIAKLLDKLDNENYDVASIIHYILENIYYYNDLLNNLNIDILSKEQLKNLIYTLQIKGNPYEITSSKDLDDENFEKKEISYFEQIERVIKSNTIDMLTLKKALLLKKYGMGLNQTEFICKRYCHDIDSLKKSKLPKDVINLLESINNIYTCNSFEKLKFLYITAKRIKSDFYTTISLESSIRKEYAKMYNQSLYKVKEAHRLNESHELFTSNKQVYNLLINANYQGKTPTFYILDGDFNLQIHALGAYNSIYKRPDNFMDAWNKPKIAYHGICTSFIGNNQIAIAKGENPIYGFSQYENSALLLVGNYDLNSDDAIEEYATSINKPSTFYPPEELIKFTRHNHNEIVLERRSNKKNDRHFKRMPDYLVYIVDDINDSSNYQESSSLFNETIQASTDFNIPIVIIDRLKYAKSELAKCIELEQKFKTTKDLNILEDLFTRYITNMIGCKKFNKTSSSEYHEYFTKEKFEELYKRILNIITDKNLDHQKQLELISCLKNLIDRELTIDNNQFWDYFKEKLIDISYLKRKIKSNNQMKITVKNLDEDSYIENMITTINAYYYQASEDEKQRISEDLKNEFSLEQIIENINNRKYQKEGDSSHGRK